MAHRTSGLSKKLRGNRTPTLEQLEARLTFSIDALSDSLAMLLDSDSQLPSVEAKTSVKKQTAVKNQPPSIVKPPSPNEITQVTSNRATIAVLGKDDGGETKLTYRWQLVSAPSGSSLAFSANNSNAAKNTALTFNRAGQYSVRVTISDAAGLKTTANYRFNVVATLTSIVVTPGTGTAKAGTAQHFKAQGFDQFKTPMQRQPSFTWSASTGSINSSGLWSGTTKAGTVEIRAASGVIAGRASVSVTASAPAPAPKPAPTPAPTPSNSGSFQNPAIASLVQTYFADGSISRPEMIQILRSAGIDGTVDTTELSDLRNLVGNASKYKIPDYVSVLADDVVNGSRANTSGNLAAGSSAAQLNFLVDKWFLGTDRPTLTNSSYSYRVASGSLFNGQPNYLDQRQGALGDCYFISTLGIIAAKTPSAIQNMFIDNLDGTYTVRFFTGIYGAFSNSDGSISDGFRSGSGAADYVTVDKYFAATASGAFAYSNAGSSLTAGKSLWIALAEKAYAQWNATGKSGRSVAANTYASIEGGWMSTVSAQVLGYNANNYALASTSKQTLIGLLNSGKAVTIGTKGNSSALVGSHAYSIVGYNAQSDQFQLHNPWGSHHPGGLTYGQLQADCTYFVVADASRFIANPINMVASNVRGAQQMTPIFRSETFHRTPLQANSDVRFDELSSLRELEALVGDANVDAPTTGNFVHDEPLADTLEAQSAEQLLATIDSLFGELAEDDLLFAS